MKILKAVDTLSEKVGKFFSWFLVITMVVVMYDVIMRDFLHNPSAWGFEVTFMLWGAYFVMILAWPEVEGGHININVISKRFPLRVRAGLSLFLYLTVCLVWVGVMVKGGIHYFSLSLAQGQHSASPFGPPLYPLKATIPIGFALLGFQALATCARNLILLTKRKR